DCGRRRAVARRHVVRTGEAEPVLTAVRHELCGAARARVDGARAALDPADGVADAGARDARSAHGDDGAVARGPAAADVRRALRVAARDARAAAHDARAPPRR